MKSVLQRTMRRRTVFLSLLLLFWAGGLSFRLVQMQIIHRAEARKKILLQNQSTSLIHPQRGTIYDRKGCILARSISRESVFYHPSEKVSVSRQIKKISRLKNRLGLSSSDLRKIKKHIQKNDHFIWIQRKIEDKDAAEISKASLEGIHLREEKKRFYPQGKLASHVVGRVNLDNIGQSGIELRYQSILAGKAGKQINFFDAKRRKYRFEITKAPVDGNDIILAIDETVQFIAQQELSRAMEERQAEWGTVIVSQPYTGEILAMASYPEFDPNNPPANFALTDNIPAIRHLYDPGSTFKIITASAALEYSAVRLDDCFDCSAGSIRIAGKTFRDHAHFGVLTFPQVIIHSSNVGTIQVGQRIGREHLYDMITRFRFGKQTGIDLPAEEPGLFRDLRSWSKMSLASLSIGYEISVTPLQMLMAMNVIANQGLYIPPKMVKKVPVPSPAAVAGTLKPKRVISPETAGTIESILQDVVRFGTGRAARIEGYTVTGKTGTAQKYDPIRKAYVSNAHTASFVGYVSEKHPVFSIIVVIDDPKGPYYGGQVAAPVFRAIASQLLRYYKIPRQEKAVPQIIAASHPRGDAQ